MATGTLLTIDGYEQLPAEQAEGYELIDGELIPVATASLGHNEMRDLFLLIMAPIVRGKHLGRVVAEQEYDFDGNAHSPDLSFCSPPKAALMDRAKRVQRLVPDLAIEIVSQSDTFESLWRKKERYRQCGTAEVWIVSIDAAEVLAYREDGNFIWKGQDRIQTNLIPGFSITVDELFRSFNEQG